MARRHQNPARGKAAAGDSDTRRSNVERLIEQGKVKEAFKEAKLYFHREASPENRQFVERTYLLRIQELIRGGMVSAGREVALSMLEFGVKDQGLMQEVVLLLPQVGLADKALALQEQLHSPEGKARLLIKLADRAVLHPEETLASLQELHDAASPVRLALAALDSNNDAQALELLQPIPRSSPMADWRYFVRGLAAFRHNDLEQAKANWERLDPQRAARKIAVALLSVSDQKLGGERHDHLKALESCAFGEPVLERLADLRCALEATDWKRVLHLIEPLRKSLQRIDPRYAQRLTDVVLLPLSAELMKQSLRGAERLIKDFKAALEPLPWDPKWNRFQALLWEGPQGSADGAIQYWRKYLQDLEQGVSGLPGELRQVQALVWRRIGEISSDLASDDELETFADAPRKQNEVPNELRAQAVEALKQSLRLDPTQRKTHQLLIENYASWDRPELLIATLEELLKAFPDDVDALRQLINQHRWLDEPELVLSYVERLRKLRPLDTKLNRDEAWGRLALARHLALNGRWEEGRAEFARVEMSLKECVPPYRQLSRRAALEFKAGDAIRAEEYIEQARLALKEPTVLWLSLAVEMERYELPKPLQQRFNREFETALAKKVTSETAGKLAELIAGYFIGRVDYASRDSHVREIVRYLKRTTRLKYQEPDLRAICTMLQFAKKEDKLLASLTKRGLKLFPRSPFFLQMEAEQDIRNGPFSFNARQTRKNLEKALVLAKASQNPQDVELIPVIKQTLSRVQDMGSVMTSFPFMPDGMPNTPDEFRDMFQGLFNRFGDIEDDEPEADESKQPPKRKRR